ncbi:DUF4124 domain-containing protein [Marinobacter sp. SS21]|uniref:DUF4124 domain-containing protein n=1 Tax=Marinobacter sp. SS21 TaxID=2979460 RepID=UPI0023306E48|nr:DUF4124 domain-containing protein [Marinobacter sp. SS21]MDC0661309.1 DUF4124 domain-containing protein [Marinobacter sp. SS21]
MRWLIRLAFPALALLLLLITFGINDPDAVPETAESPQRIPAFEGLVPPPTPQAGPEIIFKWQDSDGGWHYADRPPEQGQWNALAIEPEQQLFGQQDNAGNSNWQEPYRAPFSLTPRNDS